MKIVMLYEDWMLNEDWIVLIAREVCTSEPLNSGHLGVHSSPDHASTKRSASLSLNVGL